MALGAAAADDKPMGELAVRGYRAGDLPELFRICLLTGKDGGDASGQVDAELLGGIYVGPYCEREPESAFVLTLSGEVSGYVLGTLDTAAFGSWCEANWWPALRQRYPATSQPRTWAQRLANGIHRVAQPPPFVAEYPVHLHINLLPAAQGAGQGRALLDGFIAYARAQGVPGVHLEVSARNQNAIGFYRHYGFTDLGESDGGLYLGLRTD